MGCVRMVGWTLVWEEAQSLAYKYVILFINPAYSAL
jgi:hypothetical protein